MLPVLFGILAAMILSAAIIQISGIYDIGKGLRQAFQKDKDVYLEGKKAYDASIEAKLEKGEAAFNQRAAMKAEYMKKYPKATEKEVEDAVKYILELNMSPQDYFDFIKEETAFVQSKGNDEETAKLQKELDDLKNKVPGVVPPVGGGGGGSGGQSEEDTASGPGGLLPPFRPRPEEHPVDTEPPGNGTEGAKCGRILPRDADCNLNLGLECSLSKICQKRYGLIVGAGCTDDSQCINNGRCSENICRNAFNSVGQGDTCYESGECKDNMICSSSKRCIVNANTPAPQTPAPPVTVPPPVTVTALSKTDPRRSNGASCIPSSDEMEYSECTNSDTCRGNPPICTGINNRTVRDGGRCAIDIHCNNVSSTCTGNRCTPAATTPVITTTTPVREQPNCGPDANERKCPVDKPKCSQWGYCGPDVPDFTTNGKIAYNYVPPASTKLPNNTPCSSDSQCETNNCLQLPNINPVCADKSNVDGVCMTDSNCMEALTCTLRKCKYKANQECTGDAQCSSGLKCLDSTTDIVPKKRCLAPVSTPASASVTSNEITSCPGYKCSPNQLAVSTTCRQTGVGLFKCMKQDVPGNCLSTPNGIASNPFRGDLYSHGGLGGCWIRQEGYTPIPEFGRRKKYKILG